MQNITILSREFEHFPGYAQHACSDILKAKIKYSQIREFFLDEEDESQDQKELKSLRSKINDSVEQFKSLHPPLVEELYAAFRLAHEVLKNEQALFTTFNSSFISLRENACHILLGKQLATDCFKEDLILSIISKTCDGDIPHEIGEMDEEYFLIMYQISKSIKRYYSSRNYALQQVTNIYREGLQISELEARKKSLLIYQAASDFILASKKISNPEDYMKTSEKLSYVA